MVSITSSDLTFRESWTEDFRPWSSRTKLPSPSMRPESESTVNKLLSVTTSLMLLPIWLVSRMRTRSDSNPTPL
jgi:hypothetical protein